MSMRGVSRLARPVRRYCTSQYQYIDQPLTVPTIEVQAQQFAGESSMQSTVHNNGLRIVSQDMGEAWTQLGFYIDAGAMYESKDLNGVSWVGTEALLKSNLISSRFNNYKTFMHAGASYYTGQVGKRWVSVNLECRRDLVPAMMQCLVQAIFVPRFANAEIEGHDREMSESVAVNADKDAYTYTIDKCVQTAFAGSCLANVSYVPKVNTEKLTHIDCINWWAKYFQTNRILLCGVNVSNEELISAFDEAEWSCSADPSNPSHHGFDPIEVPKQHQLYTGGQFREFYRRTDRFQREKHYNDVMVAYARRGPGASVPKDYALGKVAAALVGNTLSMESEFGRPSCGVGGLYEAFDTAGLVGGMLRARPDDSTAATKDMVAKVNNIKNTSSDQLDGAKAVAKIDFAQSVSSRSGLTDFMARHITPAGALVTPDDMLGFMDEVTLADIKRIAEWMNGAPPTMVAYGECNNVPTVQALEEL